uniref:Uncharacterized protein n=2 Tax=Octactis speculum TaxID=3111310 RepID=A0A7S2HLD4_9STRA|mmetsp:Transcript_7517/g.9342  ORF Transcript_7517/g.9342 Transcript_7517/m.9342 type:complete len:100 (+) Transcript_7517:700-999(+)
MSRKKRSALQQEALMDALLVALKKSTTQATFGEPGEYGLTFGEVVNILVDSFDFENSNATRNRPSQRMAFWNEKVDEFKDDVLDESKESDPPRNKRKAR